MRSMSRSLSYLCSGGVQTTSCCVTTSNTNLIRTAAQATPSSTCPAASGLWSSSWTWTTLAFTSAPWERNTSFLTTGSRWSEYQVSRAADGPGAKKRHVTWKPAQEPGIMKRASQKVLRQMWWLFCCYLVMTSVNLPFKSEGCKNEGFFLVTWGLNKSSVFFMELTYATNCFSEAGTKEPNCGGNLLGMLAPTRQHDRDDTWTQHSTGPNRQTLLFLMSICAIVQRAKTKHRVE